MTSRRRSRPRANTGPAHEPAGANPQVPSQTLPAPADILRTVAASLGYAFTLSYEPSAWLRGRLAAIRVYATPCGHLGAFFAPLWSSRIVCSACLPAERPQGEANYQCDRCRVIAHPLTLAAGECQGLLVMWGMCLACTAREVPREVHAGESARRP